MDAMTPSPARIAEADLAVQAAQAARRFIAIAAPPDADEEAEEQAHRDALPARLATALASVLPLARANGLPPRLLAQAGNALVDYLDVLLDAEGRRDLTDAEAAFLAGSRAVGGSTGEGRPHG